MRPLPFGALALLFLAPAVQANDITRQPVAAVAIQGWLPLIGTTEPVMFLEAFALDDSETDLGLGHFAIEILPFIEEAGLYDVFSVDVTAAALLLHGQVIRARDPALLRTPLSIAVDRSTNETTVVFGPIPAGKLMGQSFTFSGALAVKVICLKYGCESELL
jgi:hypothetical protein